MKKKILVIEDEEDLAEIIKMRLQANGYAVEVAYDGEAGLDKAYSSQPDLIILDLMLPKKTGLEVLREVKRPTSKLRKKPIIVLSAMRDTITLLDAEKLGATDYLMKPYEIQDLLGLIKKYIV